MKSQDEKKAAIVSGSFDPITIGHVDIIERASRIFDRVYVAALINPDKKYLLDKETRKKTLEAACAAFPNVSVVCYDGYLVELCRELDCNAIIRGVRNAHDLEYEIKMAEWNKNAYEKAETLLLPCSRELCDVSSSRVRSLIANGCTDEAERLLPRGVMKMIEEMLGEIK